MAVFGQVGFGEGSLEVFRFVAGRVFTSNFGPSFRGQQAFVPFSRFYAKAAIFLDPGRRRDNE